MNIASVDNIYSNTINDSYTRIIKRISEEVSIKLLQDINLWKILKDSSSYNLYFHDDLEALSKLKDDHGKAKVSHNRCDVVIEPIYDIKSIDIGLLNFTSDMLIGINKSIDTNILPIFVDSKYNIKLVERSIINGINLTFNIRLKDIENIDKTLLYLHSKKFSNKIFEYNDLNYDYSIPFNILYILFILFKLRNNDLNFNFKEYLKLGSTSNIDISIDQKQLLSKSNPQFQFNVNLIKTQVKTLGKIDYDLKYPDSEKKNKIVDRYLIEFNYKIVYARPILLQLFYPSVINNKRIPENLITNKTIDSNNNPETLKENIAISNTFYLINHRDYNLKKYKTIIFPKDEYPIPITQILDKEFIIIFQGILGIEYNYNNEPYIEINLKEHIFPLIKDYHDIDFLEKIIILQRNRTKYAFGSLINISIFKNSKDNQLIVEKSKFYIDKDLNIIITDKIDDHYIYRIIIAINSNLKYVDKDIIKEILNNPIYTDAIIYKNLNNLVGNKYIKIKKLSPTSRDTFLINIPKKDTLYLKNDKDYKTNFIGERYGPYQPFRIGNYIIYPRIR